MTAGHSYSTLRAYERCVAGMLADPQVTGDLLLVGMWLARLVHLRGFDVPDQWMSVCAADLLPAEFDGWKVWDVLKRDIRRYDLWADQPGKRGVPKPCAGPAVRKATCGKPAYRWALFTDVHTGRRRMVGACRKHVDWFEAERRANLDAVKSTEVPRPPANAGGGLVPHLPGIDWPALWRGLDPEWTAPPEVETWAKPTLRLLVTPPSQPDSPDRSEPRCLTRPRFAVINGAKS